jgi:hypothetical protein
VHPNGWASRLAHDFLSKITVLCSLFTIHNYPLKKNQPVSSDTQVISSMMRPVQVSRLVRHVQNILFATSGKASKAGLAK